MKSSTLPIYKSWLEAASQESIDFVDSVYALCEEHYEHGGSVVVEAMTPGEILEEFKDLAQVRKYCGLRLEQALNARWGEDDDPQVEDMRRFEEEW